MNKSARSISNDYENALSKLKTAGNMLRSESYLSEETADIAMKTFNRLFKDGIASLIEAYCETAHLCIDELGSTVDELDMEEVLSEITNKEKD